MIIFYKNFSLVLSFALHVFFLIFLFIGFSGFFINKKNTFTKQVVVIDTISLGEFNNIKFKKQVSRESNGQSYNSTIATSIAESSKNDIKKDNIQPLSQNNKITKKEKKTKIEEVKPKSESIKKSNSPKSEKSEKEKVFATPQDELGSILRSLQKSHGKNKLTNVEKNSDGIVGKGNANYDINHPMTIKAIDLIRSKFVKCWNVPIGAQNVEHLQIKVKVILAPDGKVINAIIPNRYQYNNNSFFRVMADSALRAVYNCSPFQGLPEKHYSLWREIELNFDPRDMV